MKTYSIEWLQKQVDEGKATEYFFFGGIPKKRIALLINPALVNGIQPRLRWMELIILLQNTG